MTAPRSRWSAESSPSTGLATASSISEWSLSRPKRTSGTCSSRFRAQNRCAGWLPPKSPPSAGSGVAVPRFNSSLDYGPEKGRFRAGLKTAHYVNLIRHPRDTRHGMRKVHAAVELIVFDDEDAMFQAFSKDGEVTTRSNCLINGSRHAFCFRKSDSACARRYLSSSFVRSLLVSTNTERSAVRALERHSASNSKPLILG